MTLLQQKILVLAAVVVLANPLTAASQTITEIIDGSNNVDGAGNRLDTPVGIAVDSATGNVYVTGNFSDNVFKITPAGVITQIIDSGGGSWPGQGPE